MGAAFILPGVGTCFLSLFTGCGGTQRLIRAVGKSKAMYLCLTGDMITAEEAERAGLVAKVVPADQLMDVAMETAKKIAGFSKPVTAMCKEAVNASYEMTLAEGIHFERRLFHTTFATVSLRTRLRSAFAQCLCHS